MTRCRRCRVCQAALALNIGALLVACGDSTAPEQRFSVAITIDQAPAAQFTTIQSGEQIISCAVRLTARATGVGSATWEDGMARFYFGKDRSTPLDSIAVTNQQVSELWGDASITAATPQKSGVELSANAPFSTSIDFRYRLKNGDVKTTTVAFDCGPRVSSAVAAPTIGDVVADVPGGELEPGDTLYVRYSASSPIGLWRTAVFVSGPCEVTRERNEPLSVSVTQTVAIPLPADCELGVPVSVAVFATDAAIQTSSRHITTSYSTVDVTPPRLSVVATSRFGTGPTAFLAGTYFAGDTIELVARSRDNHRVSKVVWEAFQGRLKDSATIALAAADTPFRLPVPAGWLGSVDVKVTAYDDARLVSPAVVAEPNAITVLPTVARQARRVAANPGVADVVFDGRRGVAYLLEWYASRVSILSLAEGRITGSVALSLPSTVFDLSASGDTLLVVLAGENALGIIDLRQPTLSLEKVPFLGLDPREANTFFALRSASNGKVLMSMSTSAPNSMRVVEVDVATGAQRVRDDVGADPRQLPFRMERTADHSAFVYLGGGCLGRYEAGLDRFVSCRAVDASYEYLSVDASGQRVLAGLEVYDGTGQLLRTLQRPFQWNTPRATALSPDGADAYYAIGIAGVAHVRVSDGQLLGRIPIPTIGGRVFVSPDGRWLVTLPGEGTSSPDIAVVDLTSPAGSVSARR